MKKLNANHIQELKNFKNYVIGLHRQTNHFKRLYEKANNKEAKDDDLIIVVSNNDDDYKPSDKTTDLINYLLEIGYIEEIENKDFVKDKNSKSYIVQDYGDLIYFLLELVNQFQLEIAKYELMNALSNDLKR